MDKDLADALLTFYQQILKPEFDAIKAKQAEHDEWFDKICSRLADEAAAAEKRLNFNAMIREV